MFESFLAQHDAAAWARVRESLAPAMHEVDRDATRVWFHFFPLALAQAFANGDDAALVKALEIEGTYLLAEQIDTSHCFLYGHRYWPQVKAAIVARAESQTPPVSLQLDAMVRDLAGNVSGQTHVGEPLLLGIVMVGLMTLQQVGLDAFRAIDASTRRDTMRWLSPEKIVEARKKDDSQGLLGMFRGIRAEYTVRFDERRDDARFTLVNGQHLTTASALDRRDYSGRSRRYQEGPIPIRCRSAACGSCWVGVLGGAGKLSAVEPLEAKRMKEFGYIAATDSRPTIRLACMARASGNVTIVVPPWQGLLGKAGLGGL